MREGVHGLGGRVESWARPSAGWSIKKKKGERDFSPEKRKTFPLFSEMSFHSNFVARKKRSRIYPTFKFLILFKYLNFSNH
jgi:hypothetical protein